MPVESIESKWHVNILQKIPLSPDRDKVRDSWLKQLYTILVINAQDLITTEDTNQGWVSDTIKDLPKMTMLEVVRKKFGTDRIALTSTNDSANQLAALDGYRVISGAFDGETNRALVAAGLANFTSGMYPAAHPGVKVKCPQCGHQWEAKGVSA